MAETDAPRSRIRPAIIHPSSPAPARSSGLDAGVGASKFWPLAILLSFAFVAALFGIAWWWNYHAHSERTTAGSGTEQSAPAGPRWLGYANLAPYGQDGYQSDNYDYDVRTRAAIGPDLSGVKVKCSRKLPGGVGYEHVACNGASDQAFYLENETGAPLSKHVGLVAY